MSIGRNITYYRKANGWSQGQLAEKMSAAGFGMFQATIQRIEAGTRQVRLTEAYALATTLGCSVAQIGGFEDPARMEVKVSLEAAIEILVKAQHERNLT